MLDNLALNIAAGSLLNIIEKMSTQELCEALSYPKGASTYIIDYIYKFGESHVQS